MVMVTMMKLGVAILCSKFLQYRSIATIKYTYANLETDVEISTFPCQRCFCINLYVYGFDRMSTH